MICGLVESLRNVTRDEKTSQGDGMKFQLHLRTKELTCRLPRLTKIGFGAYFQFKKI